MTMRPPSSWAQTPQLPSFFDTIAPSCKVTLLLYGESSNKYSALYRSNPIYKTQFRSSTGLKSSCNVQKHTETNQKSVSRLGMVSSTLKTNMIALKNNLIEITMAVTKFETFALF